MTHTVTWGELTVRLEVEIEPYRPGRMWGEPSNCYPDTGGWAEITAAYALLPDRIVKLRLGVLGRDHVERWEREAYREWEREGEELEAERMRT